MGLHHNHDSQRVLVKEYLVIAVVIVLGLVYLCLFMSSCCQIFCIKKLRLFSRCCNIDLNKETKSNCERVFFLLSNTIYRYNILCYVDMIVYIYNDNRYSDNQ